MTLLEQRDYGKKGNISINRCVVGFTRKKSVYYCMRTSFVVTKCRSCIRSQEGHRKLQDTHQGLSVN